MVGAPGGPGISPPPGPPLAHSGLVVRARSSARSRPRRALARTTGRARRFGVLDRSDNGCPAGLAVGCDAAGW